MLKWKRRHEAQDKRKFKKNQINWYAIKTNMNLIQFFKIFLQKYSISIYWALCKKFFNKGKNVNIEKDCL